LKIEFSNLVYGRSDNGRRLKMMILSEVGDVWITVECGGVIAQSQP